MSRRGNVLLTWAVCLAVASTTKFGIAQCADTAIQQSQKQAVVAAPEYSKQIQLARQAALEIYDHGFLGNSGSAINNGSIGLFLGKRAVEKAAPWKSPK